MTGGAWGFPRPLRRLGLRRVCRIWGSGGLVPGASVCQGSGGLGWSRGGARVLRSSLAEGRRPVGPGRRRGPPAYAGGLLAGLVSAGLLCACVSAGFCLWWVLGAVVCVFLCRLGFLVAVL